MVRHRRIVAPVCARRGCNTRLSVSSRDSCRQCAKCYRIHGHLPRKDWRDLKHKTRPTIEAEK